MPNHLAGELTRAILTGGAYPLPLLTMCFARLRADREVTPLRVAMIKASLCRRKVEVPVALDRNEFNTGYQLGRLFAVLDDAQRAGVGKVNAGIRDKYVGAASATPGRVFPLLLRSAQNHLSAARKKTRGGWATNLEKELSQIMGGLSAAAPFPATLSIDDQGRFFVGYYHQRPAYSRRRRPKRVGMLPMTATTTIPRIELMTAISHRYDFVYLFDVANGNPNGDPDAGNLPRLDPETGKGLVTDVCLKRKVRNFISLVKDGEVGYGIYMSERAVLNATHREAYTALGLPVEPKKLPKEAARAQELTKWMCDNFFDIRTFGAVMSTDVNCGQVRGPIQITFARSEDPIVPLEISITRSSVSNEKDALTNDRTMGRKLIRFRTPERSGSRGQVDFPRPHSRLCLGGRPSRGGVD